MDDYNDNGTKYDLQITHTLIGVNPDFSSLDVNRSGVSLSMTPESTYSTFAFVRADRLGDDLTFHATYYWRIRVYDNQTPQQHYSDWQYGPTFTTPPHARPYTQFSFSPLNPTVGINVSFYDSSNLGSGDQSTCYCTNAPGSPCYASYGASYLCHSNPNNHTNISYSWTFDESHPLVVGNTSSNKITQVSHSYSLAGTYHTDLKICDSELGNPVTDMYDSCSCVPLSVPVRSTNPLPQWQEISPF